jgi:NADPH-dependent 2,4-dienoyl-CoA reductase/sulfur reductase-like enzyme
VICQQLEAAGIDLVHITAGTYESAWAIIPPLGRPYAWLAECAAQIKQVVKIPVQVVGRIKDPFVGETILASGQADLVSFARASLADPDLARKYAEGHPEQIRQCIGCNQGCITILFANQPIRCLVNPSLGFEGAKEIRPAAMRKKVLVVGGGPAGLEAARGARLAGHDVVLHERSDHLGGNFVVGAIPPGKGELTSYITWLREELCRLGVQIELCSTASAALVRRAAPDVVVYAAGAKHLRPSIPGIERANVVDACDVLTGCATTGRRVVIAGGGMIGSETALYLASIGRQVTIVDQLPAVALEENASRRYYLMKEFDQYKVEAVVNATITGFADTAVEVNQDGNPRRLPCDTVVVALGMTPDVELLDSLREVAEVKVIGDAVDAADGLKASREGFLCGLSL